MKFLRVIGLLTTFVFSTSAFAGHHEMSEPAIKYVLTQGFKTTNAPATATAATKFLQSGVLGERGVGMGLYSMNANAGSAANMFIDYYYPDSKSLPPADVGTASAPHVEFFGKMAELGNEGVYSTMFATVVENAPAETIGVNKVFYAYFLNVTDPSSYLGAWKGLMKDLKAEGIAPTGYGLREIVAGGENNETHMIWMGYPSMEALMDSYEKTSTSKSAAAFREKASAMRTVSRTLITSQLAIDTAEMF